jgi:hypothetical protein
MTSMITNTAAAGKVELMPELARKKRKTIQEDS